MCVINLYNKTLKNFTTMGNLVKDLPTITIDGMMRAANSSSNTNKKQTTGFDVKNYLNVRLEPGETSKTLTIRLLPNVDVPDGNPFISVHFHNVKVPREVASSGYKSYLCLSKNEGIDHEKFGHKCPFCELNRKAYQESTKETDPATQKMLKDISLANISREAMIVRCIERGKEDEGVKFWKFNLRSDLTDPYNVINGLWKQRYAEGLKVGREINIFDNYEGYDLTITITDGNAAPTITNVMFPSPISSDENQMREWILDEKKWYDVFTPKPYEYLSLISEQKIPWYDKANNMWVDKEEYEKATADNKRSYETSVKNAEDAITGSTSQVQTQVKTVDVRSMTINDDDLPY